jgi:hypothetical protein
MGRHTPVAKRLHRALPTLTFSLWRTASPLLQNSIFFYIFDVGRSNSSHAVPGHREPPVPRRTVGVTPVSRSPNYSLAKIAKFAKKTWPEKAPFLECGNSFAAF